MNELWWPLARVALTLAGIAGVLALAVCAGHVPWLNALVGGEPLGGEEGEETSR